MIFNDNKNKKPIHLFNYHFLKSIIVFLLIAIFSFGCRSVISEGNEISFGIITDLHYSNTPAHSNRLDSLNIAVQTWNDRGNVSFAVELGDFIQEVNATSDTFNQATVETALQNFNGNVYGVIGNHELMTRSADDYMSSSSIIPSEYYSFNMAGVHFIVLFANVLPFHSVDTTQLSWLANDLASSPLPTIIFTHQRMDETYPGDDPQYISMSYSSDDVRTILEADGDVLAVFSGHSHENAHVEVNGIEYFAMMNAYQGLDATYAIVNVSNSNYITVEGFGDQFSYQKE